MIVGRRSAVSDDSLPTYLPIYLPTFVSGVGHLWSLPFAPVQRVGNHGRGPGAASSAVAHRVGDRRSLPVAVL